MRWILIFFWVAIFQLGFSQAFAMDVTTCGRLFSDFGNHEIQITFKPKGMIVYHPAAQWARNILKLSSLEYEKAVLADKIPPDVILLVDTLPLHLDFPKVAGAIISSPLTTLGSHVQLQAEKMNIPLVYLPGAFNDPRLFDVVREKLNVVVDAKDSVKIRSSRSRLADPNPELPAAVLPAPVDRSLRKIVLGVDPTAFPLELIGSKFSPLAELTRKRVAIGLPYVRSISSGYYESFLDRSVYQGRSLREIVQEGVRELVGTSDETKIQNILNGIREAFLNSDSRLVFAEIFHDLLKSGVQSEGRYSVRSNNEMEDHIGSGVFSSAIAETATLEGFSQAIRSVWSSMYTYRSYAIRKAWRLREENLSMPLLIHEYIENEKLSGTGNFVMDKEGLLLKMNIVLGSQTKATNPGQDAFSYSMDIREVEGQARFVGPRPEVPPALETKLLSVFKNLKSVVLEDFRLRSFRPTSIDIEFLLNNNLRPKLMQYKRRQSRELTLDLLKGKLKLEDLERSFSLSENKNENDLLNGLRNYSIDVLGHAEFALSFVKARAAVIKVDGKDRIIVWNWRYHDDIPRILAQISPRLKWVGGGYIKIDSKQGLVKFASPGDDFGVNLAHSSVDIEQAIQNEFAANPTVFAGINRFEFYDRHSALERTLEIRSWHPYLAENRWKNIFKRLKMKVREWKIFR